MDIYQQFDEAIHYAIRSNAAKPSPPTAASDRYRNNPKIPAGTRSPLYPTTLNDASPGFDRSRPRSYPSMGNSAPSSSPTSRVPPPTGPSGNWDNDQRSKTRTQQWTPDTEAPAVQTPRGPKRSGDSTPLRTGPIRSRVEAAKRTKLSDDEKAYYHDLGKRHGLSGEQIAGLISQHENELTRTQKEQAQRPSFAKRVWTGIAGLLRDSDGRSQPERDRALHEGLDPWQQFHWFGQINPEYFPQRRGPQTGG